MASPLKSGKQSVNLASSGVKVSRIRRDPPPVVKEKPVDLKERERRMVVIGVVTFALSIFVIILGFSSYSSREAMNYTVEVRVDE